MNDPIIPTRAEIASHLVRVLPGVNLHELARRHGVTVGSGKTLNKGWVGQTLERVAGLKSNNAQRPDGIDFELKSTTLLRVGESWKPKETIKVTQLNPQRMLEETFTTSVLWKKLKALIVVGLEHESTSSCKVVLTQSVDIENLLLTQEIKVFWEEVQLRVFHGEMPQFPDFGTSEDLIQLRPVGRGKQWTLCPITGEKFPARAFYATKRLIAAILPLNGS